jgi:hypothetical protein
MAEPLDKTGPVELAFRLVVDRDVWNSGLDTFGAFGVFLKGERVDGLATDEDGGIVYVEGMAVKVVHLSLDEMHYRMSFAEEGDRPVPSPPSPGDKEPF